MRDLAASAFERLFGPEFGHGKPFDLAHLRAALKALGDPRQKLPPVIHVAGTNGKGSAIAFMRAIAEAAGLKAHAFTKPHLSRLNERFVVAGELANDEALIDAAERVAAVSAEVTQFDAQVAAAFLMFSETSADIVLLETGMGGRNDSTNVIERPAMSVVTPIGWDHRDALGPQLTDIAAHKAGILKGGSPTVIARQHRDVMAVIEARAAEVGAPLYRAGVEWDAFTSAGRLVVQTETRALDLPLPALQGSHQIDNAGLACSALMAWSSIEDDAFAAGVAGACLPARLQALTRGTLSAPVRARAGEVWLDGAHNAHGAQALARALKDMQRRREAVTVAVVGMRAGKDAEAFIGALAGVLDRIIAVPLAEAHVAPVLISKIAGMMGVDAREAQSLEAAMQSAAQAPAPRVLICGSFLLAAAALKLESD